MYQHSSPAEGWLSGLRRATRNRECFERGTVGSNPTPSAIRRVSLARSTSSGSRATSRDSWPAASLFMDQQTVTMWELNPRIPCGSAEAIRGMAETGVTK